MHGAAKGDRHKLISAPARLCEGWGAAAAAPLPVGETGVCKAPGSI
jgi:hypothetical protein